MNVHTRGTHDLQKLKPDQKMLKLILDFDSNHDKANLKPKSRDVALDLVHVVFSDALVLRLALLLELPRTLQ